MRMMKKITIRQIYYVIKAFAPKCIKSISRFVLLYSREGEKAWRCSLESCPVPFAIIFSEFFFHTVRIVCVFRIRRKCIVFDAEYESYENRKVGEVRDEMLMVRKRRTKDIYCVY